MPLHLALAAAGKQQQEVGSRRLFGGIRDIRRAVQKRMADELHAQTRDARGIPGFFERKNAEKQVVVAL